MQAIVENRRARWSARWRHARRAGAASAWLFYYNTRFLFSRQVLALLVLAGGGFAAALLNARPSTNSECFRFLYIFECAIFVLLTMNLITSERDNGTLALSVVSAVNMRRWVAMKFLPAAVWTLALGIVAKVVLDRQVGGFPGGKALFFAYTTALAVGCATLYFSVRFRNGYLGAAVAAAGALALYAAFQKAPTLTFLHPFLDVFETDRLRPISMTTIISNRFYLFMLSWLMFDQTLRRMRKLELWFR